MKHASLGLKWQQNEVSDFAYVKYRMPIRCGSQYIEQMSICVSIVPMIDWGSFIGLGRTKRHMRSVEENIRNK